MSSPKVSVIMATYNRADTLPRAIESVLRQDMPDWELIIVDDGSTDTTRTVIEHYMAKDARIRVVSHECNLHVHAAKNTGFDLMRGEWFTTLDSDDEMVPSALTAMLQLLERVDPAIDAITCNCLNTTTGEFSGKGLNHNQWLDFKTLVTQCSGEHWGLTKRSLLGDLRFNRNMRGSAENILWWRLSRHARRYYLHQALRVYHTEGGDRISCSGKTINLQDRIGYYLEMSKESDHLGLLKEYRPTEHALIQRNIALVNVMTGRRVEARKAYNEAKSRLPIAQRLAVGLALLGGRRVALALVKAVVRVR